MKKITTLVLFVFLLTAAFLSAEGSKEEGTKTKEPQVLTISTWGYNMDLLDKNITVPFEKKYNVKLVYEKGNNSSRLTKLAARKDKPIVDVVHFAGNYTFKAIEQGLLQPYDPSKLPNLKDLYKWAQDPLGNRYGVGYSVSHYGLFYRTDKISKPITSWRDLWRPEVKGYVTLPDIATTNGPATIILIAKAWGGNENNVDIAWKKLESLKGSIVNTYRRSSELTTMVKQGEVWVGPYASFAWGNLLKTGFPLKSVVPEEGLVGFMSVVSIVKGTKKEDLAYKYIDFLISKQVEEAEAMDLVDSPTNTKVKVPADIAGKLTYGDKIINSLIFLDQKKLAGLQKDWINRWNSLMTK
ncbi:MAG: ABC transporter substrate-binding protein [Spirochaetes bacterium]|nr:MAG: ABC transporter substrate-binding protein [Spirochaetota bacterium]